jgi:hypothetical protein
MTKCAICRGVYIKWSMSQKVCGKVECAKAFARKTILKIEQKARKEEAKAIHQRKMDLQPRRYWVHKAKLYFHRYIRMRDKDQPCISCGATLQPNKYGGSVDAGHYRSVGSAKHLEFEPLNVHAQCKRCNRDLSGNYSEYRKGLIERIGLGEVERLEANQATRKLSITELKELITLYKTKWNELQ